MVVSMFVKLVPSAKWCTLGYLIAQCKLFIYIKSSKGPNTEDWDTPYLMSEKLELNPLIDANNFILLL